MTEKNLKLISPNQMNNPIHKLSFGRKPKANEHTHIYHYCLLQEIQTQNLQKFNTSTYNLPGLTGLPSHHRNPLLTRYLIGFLTYAIRCTSPWTPYSYCFLQSAKSWLQLTLYLQIFFKCMLKLSASSQMALYTTAYVLQHTLDLLTTVQCDTEHSYMFTQWHCHTTNTCILSCVSSLGHNFQTGDHSQYPELWVFRMS
jgi:hypothetical protein